MSLNPSGRSRQDRLLRSLQGARAVTVVTHDNPDPDAIAAGWALAVLCGRVLDCPARIRAGGAITRAENRALVDFLCPPLELTDEWLLPEADTAVVVVDTIFSARLAAWPVHVPLAAVIDHHEHEPSALRGGGSESRLKYRFRDIRPAVAAASSMVAGYLRALEIVPEKGLATALLYGIRTDAQRWEVKFSGTDRTALAWLGHHYDPELLARIERPRLPRSYYEDLLLGLESSFTYQNVAFAFLSNVGGAELVSELADLLVRCEGVDRVLCAAVRGGNVILSARSSTGAKSAAELLAETLNGEGSCGGHASRAGGTIPLKAGNSSLDEIESRLRGRWLAACNVSQQRGTRLVAKREILKALD